MSGKRWTVHVAVTLDASNDVEAMERVKKALVCLENSLRYAQPEVSAMDQDPWEVE